MHYLVFEDGFVKGLYVLARSFVDFTLYAIWAMYTMTRLRRIAVVVANFVAIWVLSHDDWLNF